MIKQFFRLKRIGIYALLLMSLSAKAADENGPNNTAAPKWTLAQWIEKAREKSETLKAAEAKKSAARENERLVFSQIYPKLNASYVFSRSDTGPAAAQNGQTFVLSAEQQLFKGLGEWRALRASSQLFSAAHQSYLDESDRLEHTVLLKLLDLALLEKKNEIFSNTLKIVTRRITEMQRRARLGKYREVDVWQSEIERLNLERKISATKDSLTQGKTEVASLLRMATTDLPILPSLNSIVEGVKALAPGRADFELKSQSLTVNAKKSEARAEQGAYWPALSAYGNYYPHATGAATVLKNDWEIGLKLSWNFFSGFSTPATVRKNFAEARVLEAGLLEAQRQRSIEKTNLQLLTKELAFEMTKLEESRKLSEKSYLAQERDYRLGIVTSLEVLSSLQTKLDLEVEFASLEKRLAELIARSRLIDCSECARL